MLFMKPYLFILNLALNNNLITSNSMFYLHSLESCPLLILNHNPLIFHTKSCINYLNQSNRVIHELWFNYTDFATNSKLLLSIFLIKNLIQQLRFTLYYCLYQLTPRGSFGSTRSRLLTWLK